MLRRMCRSKIHNATVTESRIDYKGSIQIDASLMKAADLLEHEMVLVANMSNGERFETYVIKGKSGSGVIGLNGAAARLGIVGDKLIIMAAGWMEERDAKQLKPKFIYLNEKNRLKR